jgi:uroporphyrinogen-III synthase
MSLKGKRVALLEARMSAEIASMVERFGGSAYSVPAVREIPLDLPDEATAFVDALCAGRFDIVVFMTGVGASALLKEAEKRGQLDAALIALRGSTTVCRGPKPVSVLRRQDVQVNITAAEPHTTIQLLQALEAVVHYGERSEQATDAFTRRGASVSEICLYEWRLPDDVTALRQLVDEIIDGKIDALAVTSQIQIRHLFEIADKLGKHAALADALNRQTVVAAVGPVCATALRSYGVIPHVQPSHPKMGPMMLALSDYFELTAR